MNTVLALVTVFSCIFAACTLIIRILDRRESRAQKASQLRINRVRDAVAKKKGEEQQYANLIKFQKECNREIIRLNRERREMTDEYVFKLTRIERAMDKDRAEHLYNKISNADYEAANDLRNNELSDLIYWMKKERTRLDGMIKEKQDKLKEIDAKMEKYDF